ncbi:MAG: LD-carboxypeptidase [Victivallales bacterium]|nr:LD-carboxypeptidase [Victivallales bacterium]
MNPFPPIIHTIGLFSLSGVVDAERLARGLSRLAVWGIRTILPRPATPLPYLSGTDEERIRMFYEVLDNPQVDALMALRGGYGVTRILDDLDWKRIRQRDIPIIGYSDVTALHLAAWKNGCTKQIHGPMLCSTFGYAEEDTATAQTAEISAKALCDCLAGIPFPMLPGEKLEALKPGKATAPIIPMNFTLLRSLIGTPHFPSLDNTILLVEDVDEAAYSVDRMLAQLRSANILQKLAGLLFGQFTNGEHSELLPELFQHYAKYVNGPVASGLPVGHGKPITSIRFGATITLETDEKRVKLNGEMNHQDSRQ